MNGPRERITKERILDKAFLIAEENGVESLSMRKIAGDLGIKAMSLYNHVTNKEEIVDGLIERVVGEFEVPRLDDDWKSAMRIRAKSAHKTLRRHPWAIMALMNSKNAGPMMLRYVDATLGCLTEAGFSYEIADHAWNAMDNHIYGFTLQEVNFPFEETQYADTARDFLPRITIEDYPYFTELATLIMEKRYSGVHDFSFGLDLILDGLERYRFLT